MAQAGFEYFNDNGDDWLSDLELSDAEIGDEFPDWRQEHDEPPARPAPSRATAASRSREARRRAAEPDDLDPDEGRTSVIGTGARPARPYRPSAYRPSAGERTRTIIDKGRRTAARGRFSRGRKMTIVTAAAAVAVAAAVTVLLRPHAQWPASVAVVKNEIAAACRNPNVVSEPNQVNFACSDATNQILWVFALMTSGDNPDFADAKTGRKGLEPIAPSQGGAIAWSLNLHHPYNPDNPMDSLQVAARAINNIVGGATITGANGEPTVQPGLESNPANCARYTGSSAIISHAGFPSLCAEPITSAAGQALLVANIYQSWVVGASTQAAENVSVLFENSNNPGAAQVQAILKTLPGATAG